MTEFGIDEEDIDNLSRRSFKKLVEGLLERPLDGEKLG